MEFVQNIFAFLQTAECLPLTLGVVNVMRIDKFLKSSRLIKRRTIAKEACDQGRVLVNEKIAKAGTEIEIGDIITIVFGSRTVKVEVKDIREHVKKDDAKDLYQVME